MTRTLSIGGATYDLFVRTGHEIVKNAAGEDAFTLPLGKKIRVQSVMETCGGGADNTAVGLARLGCSAQFAGVIGDDQWGQKILRNLEREKVGTDCLTVVEKEVTSFSIILSASSGERVILYEPGTNAHLHDVTFDRDEAAGMDWVYLNHIMEESCVIQDDIIDLLATEGGPKITWNPGGCQIDTGLDAPNNATLLKHTTLLLLNKEEALGFSKQTEVSAALRALKKAGAAIVCITDGRRGATATDGHAVHTCPILDAPVMDTTGAGDAFGTGMTWALLQGFDLKTALRAGTINSASVVGAIGAQAGLLTETAMQEQLKTCALPVTTDFFS